MFKRIKQSSFDAIGIPCISWSWQITLKGTQVDLLVPQKIISKPTKGPESTTWQRKETSAAEAICYSREPRWTVFVENYNVLVLRFLQLFLWLPFLNTLLTVESSLQASGTTSTLKSVGVSITLACVGLTHSLTGRKRKIIFSLSDHLIISPFQSTNAS